jgi:DNA-binding NtrC family response regulator
LNKKILILNQDIEELSLIRKLLTREGCEVITASNWETAQKLMNSIDIDYVLLNMKHQELPDFVSSFKK